MEIKISSRIEDVKDWLKILEESNPPLFKKFMEGLGIDNIEDVEKLTKLKEGLK